LVLVAILYAITRELDLKTTFLGLVVFFAGRQSRNLLK
jgi:hypothetical protein